MSGNNIVADTSLIINFFNGHELSKKVLKDQQIWISCISEIELLSFPSLSKDDQKIIRSFVDHCIIVALSKPIRELAINIRRNNKLKVPDAIIAATSIHLGFPVVTMDSDFNNLKNVDAVILEL